MPEVVAAGWSQPVKLAGEINTPCPEDAIEVSPDGSMLYFYWSPTVGAEAAELLTGTTGTYRATLAQAGPPRFEGPTFFDLRAGTLAGACDGELSFTPDGTEVFFHSLRAENTGFQLDPPTDDFLDIYVAQIVDGKPGPGTNLGAPVNSPSPDGEHCLSPDGMSLYLSSDRPGGVGKVDIWVSQKGDDGWSDPSNIGAPLNSPGGDLQPAFAPDDPDTLYFVSDRDGPPSIYVSHREAASWTQPQMILTGFVGEPTLVADGSLLYFVHVLVDDDGVFGADIWYLMRQERGSGG
jgi:Tol biopolymer transport system component